MKNEFQKHVDEQLSQLEWNEHAARRVWDKVHPKPCAHKRLTACLAMMLVLMVSIGVAAGIRFSQKYDAQKLAEETLLHTYGITDEMLTFFSRDVQGSVHTYRGIDTFAELLGTYTVCVEKDSAVADWSLKDAAYAWNSGKLQAVTDACKQENGFARMAEEAHQAKMAAGLMETQPSVQPTDDEIASMMARQQKEKEQAQSLAKLEWTEIDRLARAAIRERYALNDAQMGKLELVEESCWWKMQGSTPIAEPYYWLTLNEGGWTVGDGIYIAEINAETGVIEGIIYDSGIAGNG